MTLAKIPVYGNIVVYGNIAVYVIVRVYLSLSSRLRDLKERAKLSALRPLNREDTDTCTILRTVKMYYRPAGHIILSKTFINRHGNTQRLPRSVRM